MKPVKQYMLLILQLLIVAVLAVLYGKHTGASTLWWSLFVLLTGITGLQIAASLRFRGKLRHMTAELQRAVDGNLKVRLLAKEEQDWNEIIFAINALIGKLEKVQMENIQSQAARESLLSGISHDLRTPLTSIIGYVDALKDGVASSEEQKQAHLEILSVKSNALKALIDDIFTMAKLDADEMPLQEERLDFAELAREALIEILPETNKYGISCHIIIPEKPCRIAADRFSMMRILGNILRNAVQYGKEGNWLGVELTETAEAYELLIWDRGPGIPVQELPYIFDRSYRGDHTRSTHNGGSGLGLAIAKALAEKDGGRIRVDSQPWEKTVFGIRFPKN